MAIIGDVDEDQLRRAVASAGIDVRPTWFDEVGSTNTVAMELAAGGAPAWTVVGAGHQTAGRGRLGRTWTDAAGALLVSVIVRPALRPEQAPLATLLAATAMVEAAGAGVARSKWPNDILAGERKAGGILAEARVADGRVGFVVVGSGVNVRGEPPREAGESATSHQAAGGHHDEAAVLERYLRAFRAGTDDPSFPAGVVDAYAEVCATLGRRVRATTRDGASVEGVAAGLDDRGGLLLETEDGPVTVSFGEVEHLR